MKLNSDMINEMIKYPHLSTMQIEFIKLLEGTDLPIQHFTDMVELASDRSIEEMKTFLDTHNIFVKKLFL